MEDFMSNLNGKSAVLCLLLAFLSHGAVAEYAIVDCRDHKGDQIATGVHSITKLEMNSPKNGFNLEGTKSYEEWRVSADVATKIAPQSGDLSSCTPWLGRKAAVSVFVPIQKKVSASCASGSVEWLGENRADVQERLKSQAVANERNCTLFFDADQAEKLKAAAQ
jgi:hypothetical protein